MDYTAHLDGALSRLHEEGRYRTFIDIEREKGNFPHAMWNCLDGSKKPIVVWCGNEIGRASCRERVLSSV